MVAQRIPLNDLQFGEREAIYIAALERRIASDELMIGRFRALLEMLTGDQWDDVNITTMENSKLKSIAATVTAKRLAITMEQANRVIDERIASANEVR